MSYLALYRKYRPSNFEDLVGQSEVSTIIKREILSGKISHAYLFSGPRGTGKTSTAKIIAKMINCSNLGDDCLPCGKCPSCVNFDSSNDVVEIDAASNNGVDEIRELRDKVNLVPAFGKYKVYIIDEVHMLTTQAFNALLKTLEEPPAHIIFILATTEFHKIPITVVSRCQKFQFLKFTNEDIVNRLSFIAEKESISVDNLILNEIARLSDGGMRDAINMLDQLSSFDSDELKIDDLYRLNGVVSYSDLKNLFQYISNNDVVSIVKFVENLDHDGKSLDRFIGDLIDFLKDVLVSINTGSFECVSSDKSECLKSVSSLFDSSFIYDFIISLNDLAVRAKSSTFVKILLVTELIKISNSFNDNYSDSIEKNNLVDNNIVVNNCKVVDVEINNRCTKISDKEKMIRINNSFATASKELKEVFVSKWSSVVDLVFSNSSYVSITGMINDISVMVVGVGYVIFVAQYDSLLDRLYEQLDSIERMLFEVYNSSYRVVFLAKDEWNYEKDKYVSDLKSGKKYEIIESTVDNSSDGSNIDSSDVDKIISVFGEDIISYE